MNKRTANKRDQRALEHRAWQVRFGYRVGSFFKACEHCAEKLEVELASGRVKTFYLSGYDVFRIYQPSRHGFMYWCYTCGAKDEQCWAPSDSNQLYTRWLASRTRLDI